MLLNLFFLIAGLVLVLVGANFMTDGSVALAKRMGMSDFIVGLTIVAMMTSAPELVVSITSAFNASPGMAIGNVVGSNIFNILIIIGVTAIIRPISVTGGMLVNDIPLVVLSSAVLLAMGSSPWLDGSPMELTRVDGVLLLLFFAIFMRYTFASAKAGGENAADAGGTDTGAKPPMALWKALLITPGGLGLLILGGDWFVDGASGLAKALGWSEAMIGLTILAAGTSLPELATSVVSAVRGFPGIALGNVIGSCIFNVFFVLGCSSLVTELPFGGVSIADLIVMTVASILFWAFGRLFGHRIINRAEGVLLVLIYVGYITWLAVNL